MSPEAERLRRRGWILLRGGVGAAAIARANAAIDRSLVERYEPQRQLEYDHRSYCPELRSAPPIVDLLAQQPLRGVLDALLGWEGLQGRGHAQIAIRRAHNAAERLAPEWHIDGVSTPHNGVVGEALHTFTALVGVFLSDLPRPWRGNFVAWPDSTAALSAWFREDPARMRQGMPRIDPGEPVQLQARAGDVVVANYLLAHAAAVNTCDQDRRAVFFRLSLPDLGEHRHARLVRPWEGWRLSAVPSGILGGHVRSTR